MCARFSFMGLVCSTLAAAAAPSLAATVLVNESFSSNPTGWQTRGMGVVAGDLSPSNFGFNASRGSIASVESNSGGSNAYGTFARRTTWDMYYKPVSTITQADDFTFSGEVVVGGSLPTGSAQQLNFGLFNSGNSESVRDTRNAIILQRNLLSDGRDMIDTIVNGATNADLTPRGLIGYGTTDNIVDTQTYFLQLVYTAATREFKVYSKHSALAAYTLKDTFTIAAGSEFSVNAFGVSNSRNNSAAVMSAVVDNVQLDSSVPEPGTSVIAMAAGAALLGSRRRRRRPETR